MTSTANSNARSHRTEKGAQRIQELLKVAAEMFLERGYEAVAVDEIIKKAGGSRRNVYDNFGGKEGLFIAALTEVCEDIGEPIAQLEINRQSPVEALSSFGRQVLVAILDKRTLAVHRLMVAEGVRFPELTQVMYNAGPQSVIDQLAGWIETLSAQPDSEINSDLPPSILAEQFLQLVLGHVQMQVLVGLMPQPLPEKDVKRIVGNAVNLFFNGVK